MIVLWFVLTCAMFGAYVVLDGYDLGAGIVSPFVGKTDGERRAVLDTILPTWDGNEVFLVAGGATLYLAFPRLFAAFVSGFYLPVMIVLWLLMLRGLGIEMRHKLDHPLWNQLWDGGFFIASLLLVFFFGAALGNVVRGVSVDAHGDFFAPLWTDFGVGEHVGILDWYTVLVGTTAVALLARHGALPVALHADTSTDAGRAVAERACRASERLLVPTGVLVLLASIATFRVQPNVGAGLAARPWTAALALGAAAGLLVSRASDRKLAFRASSAAVASLFGCACIGVYPYGLVARVASLSVLAADAAADPHALGVGLAWWIPGMSLVITYSIAVQRRLLRR
jgi:cytochrome d ubiquinol oxidase subunit II